MAHHSLKPILPEPSVSYVCPLYSSILTPFMAHHSLKRIFPEPSASYICLNSSTVLGDADTPILHNADINSAALIVPEPSLSNLLNVLFKSATFEKSSESSLSSSSSASS